MTRRMRLSSYGALALWAFALCASSTPSRIPESQAVPQGIAVAETGGSGPASDTALSFGSAGIDDNRSLHDALVAIGPLDGTQAGGALRVRDGTRVAEPSTLLLVSFGLFGLIAWSRRRR
jgi:hypothetical protein